MVVRKCMNRLMQWSCQNFARLWKYLAYRNLGYQPGAVPPAFGERRRFVCQREDSRYPDFGTLAPCTRGGTPPSFARRCFDVACRGVLFLYPCAVPAGGVPGP